MQKRPEDWIAYLLPEQEDLLFDVVKPDKVPKAESRMDALWKLKDGDECCYLHFEPQGYFDVAFPARMLRYRADIWEYTLSEGEGSPSIRQAVLFIFPENENKVSGFEDFWDEETGISYSYRVLRVWEMDKEVVLHKKLLSLYPLIPLMKERPDETPEQVMEITVRVIAEVEDVSLRADLLTAASILAENRYASELIRKIIRREMLMGSELLKEWTAEERKEAALENSKQTLLLLLKTKYGVVPEHVERQIMAMDDQDTFNNLFIRFAQVATLDEFLVKWKE